ncbi:hypothetical protein C0216_09830 [Streptomyces globosus]|uniref:Uncharacterized protein n=1 Tax=Streptomyces globosus TaxID=68209 RepID=A0A344TYK3_9ACTN|nr:MULTISPECIES: hypothetical protein [Streptomyces]AXE23724.1 hypothetical protein C0216_09830 [Streptomyces globosus]
MSESNAPQRLGIGLLGAVLAAGLLVAACAAPEDAPHRTGAPGGTAPRGPAPAPPDGRDPAGVP